MLTTANGRGSKVMLIGRRLACSFCGKTAAQVSKLVAGRRAYICDACAKEAHRIMSDPSSDRPDGARSAGFDGVLSRLIARIRQFARFAERIAAKPA
jgi:hypothetical protein